MKERKDRIDDAVCAVQAAASEGVIAGGGLSYIAAFQAISDTLPDDLDSCSIGKLIVLNGLISVFKRILENGGFSFDEYINKIDPKNNIGVNALTGEIVNMYDAGIINPAKADRLSFENALSVLNLYLSTNCVIVDEKLVI
jgi:chaperonin GroEL